MFDTPEQKRSTGNRAAIRKLRPKGKPRRNKNAVETRGKLIIRNERIRLGYFEDLQEVVKDLNNRPRKKLGYRTPEEIWLSKTLHLI